MTTEEEPERVIHSGPEVRTLLFHCRGPRFKPWLGIVRSHVPYDKPKKQKTNKKKTHPDKMQTRNKRPEILKRITDNGKQQDNKLKV